MLLVCKEWIVNESHQLRKQRRHVSRKKYVQKRVTTWKHGFGLSFAIFWKSHRAYTKHVKQSSSSNVPWGSKLLHACRKLLGNYFSGFQVIITCMIICRKFLGNYFSALSGNFAFCYLCRIFLLPEISPKFKNYLGENFPLYWPSPHAPVFLILASCCLSPVMNA